MDAYLESGELSVEQIKAGLRIRSLANELIVGLCGSAFKNKGVQAMLDAVIEFLPAPDEVKAITGVIPNNSQEDEVEDVRKSSDEEPFSALAFKIATDPFVGTLNIYKSLFRCIKCRRCSLLIQQNQKRKSWKNGSNACK